MLGGGLAPSKYVEFSEGGDFLSASLSVDFLICYFTRSKPPYFGFRRRIDRKRNHLTCCSFFSIDTVDRLVGKALQRHWRHDFLWRFSHECDKNILSQVTQAPQIFLSLLCQRPRGGSGGCLDRLGFGFLPFRRQHGV